MNRIELIQSFLPLLYDWSTPTKQMVGSYCGKHDVEHILSPSFYFEMDEFIEACLGLGIRHKQVDERNYVFYMKPRFNMFFQRSRTQFAERPIGYRRNKWNAYLHAVEQSKSIVETLIGEPYTLRRLQEVVGWK